jgi:23S rRNA pseudouridine955/2504/2580 synthase/23S rRNA pseudouridine1911/1915/1917 synthase
MSKIALDTVLENDEFIALNKPAGVLSIPDREGKETSLKRLLEEKYGKIYVVHRIDRDTSGLIVFAKNETAHKELSQLFESREIEKYYVGLVHGRFSQPSGNITHRKGKHSETDYEVLEQFRLFSWVRFRIHTGRTHQIRVHMQHIGHTLVCDDLYGDGKPLFISMLKNDYKLSKNELDERPILSRLALHSYQLKFVFKGEEYSLEAPVPKDLRATLQQLGKQKK